MLSTTGEPNTFKAAMNSPDAAEWFAAAQKELVAHYVDAKTFTIVERQPGMREVLSKWVFKEKKNLNNVTISYKGRLVACGFSQVFGVDYFDSSAPVSSRDSLRMVLALAASENLSIVQADFANAYVIAPLDVTIYMKPPDGMLETLSHLLQPHEIELLKSGNATLQLEKAQYGLKQSGLLWYRTLCNHLIAIGLQPTVSDPCVFVNRDRDYDDDAPGAYSVNTDTRIIVIIYVDDILVFARTPELAETAVITPLQQHYNLKLIGTPSEFIGLGMHIHPDGSIFLHQRGYSEQVCEKFSDNIHAKSTPMTPAAEIDSNGPPRRQADIHGDRRLTALRLSKHSPRHCLRHVHPQSRHASSDQGTRARSTHNRCLPRQHSRPRHHVPGCAWHQPHRLLRCISCTCRVQAPLQIGHCDLRQRRARHLVIHAAAHHGLVHRRGKVHSIL